MENIPFDEETSISGIYTKSILAKRGEGEHYGHYKIVVNESLEIILLPPYEADAVRPSEEVSQFEGKKVTVTGIVSESTDMSEPSIENPPLSVNIPCFVTISSIQLAKE